METVADFIFLGSKITADGDCSSEIKRCLFLERKAMTNLGNIFKSRNITLETKGTCIVKAMVYPEIMCRCENWTIKKAEHWQNWCFQIVVLEKTLESPLYSKEIKPVNPKGNQPWIFIERTNVEDEAPKLWPPDAKDWLIGKDSDAEKDWGQKRRRGQQRMGLLDGISDSMNMSLSKLQEIVKDRKPWCSHSIELQSQT